MAREGRAMTLAVAAQVGIKDEVALIGPCLAHLRAIGVGRIWVQDMGSTDGTREWLAREVGSGAAPDLTVIDTRPTDTDEALAANIMRGVQGARDWGADWLLMIDADEFILPRGGNIGAVLSGVTEPLLMMDRYNVALGPGGLTIDLPPDPARLGETLLYAGADKWYRKKLEADPALAWLRFVPLGKAAVRPEALGGLVHGMHDALGADGAPLPRATPRPVIIAHVPLSDYPRFARKVGNIAEAFELYGSAGPEKFGWHWRRWVESARAGLLRAEYDSSHLDADEIAQLRAEGVLRSVAELLAPEPLADP